MVDEEVPQVPPSIQISKNNIVEIHFRLIKLKNHKIIGVLLIIENFVFPLQFSVTINVYISCHEWNCK